jgi:hypothetical protein
VTCFAGDLTELPEELADLLLRPGDRRAHVTGHPLVGVLAGGGLKIRVRALS